MSIFVLVVAAMLILGGLLHVTFKVMVAYSECSGGAPLLDGVIFPPIFLGVGSGVYFRHFGVAASGIVVGVISLVVMIFTYFIAWKLGSHRRH